jgi:hypothetical protein
MVVLRIAFVHVSAGRGGANARGSVRIGNIGGLGSIDSPNYIHTHAVFYRNGARVDPRTIFAKSSDFEEFEKGRLEMFLGMTIFVLIGFLFASGLGISAPKQTKQTSKQSLQVILNRCEGNNSDLSGAHHMAGEEATIIAIARLGDGEVSRQLNRRRLHNVRTFLTDVGWHRDPTTVITAEGEKVKGYGRVELYVRGVPFVALAVRRNQDLLVGSCLGADRNLYPYLARKPERSTKKH